MATVSFAVGTVSVAVVWGTFFYPPPPRATSAPKVVIQPVAAEVNTMPKVAPKPAPTLVLAGHGDAAKP